MNLFEHANLTSGLVCIYCPRIELVVLGIGIGLWLALMIYLVLSKMKQNEKETQEDTNGDATE
jgi:hypothetical protein